jgi:hypothetical protein
MEANNKPTTPTTSNGTCQKSTEQSVSTIRQSLIIQSHAKGRLPQLTPVQLVLPGASFTTPLLGIRATTLYISVDGSNVLDSGIQSLDASAVMGAWRCKALEIPQT